MGFRPEPRTSWILLAVLVGFAGAAHAECTGPQMLVATLRAQPTTENAVALGNWFAANKQFECAVETFGGALGPDPDSAQLHYLEALALVALGKTQEAVPDLQEAIRLQPDVIKPHLVLADLLEQSGQSAQADDQWKQALTIDPKSEIALESYSSALFARKDFAGVVILLHSAPMTESLALRLAQAYRSLNYLETASQVLNDALKSYPDSLPLINAESVILIKQRLYDEAVKLLAFAVDKHPDSREAELQYLRILVLTQHNDKARPLGLKLLSDTPHDAEVLYLNGVIDHAVGDYAASKAHLEEAVALVPDFFNSRYHLGVALVTLHEWNEAKENLEKAIALGDTEPQVHYQLGMALRGLGETDRAAQEIKQYQELKKAEEDNLEAASHVAQADQEAAAGNAQEAILHYRQACDEMPENAIYKFKLSIALHKTGDLEGERAQLEQAVKLDPQLAAAQKQLGYLLGRSGDAAGAVEHFQMAVHAAPAWAEAWINLAAGLAVESHFSEAREAVATALRLDPANEQAQKLSDRLAHDPAAQPTPP